MTNNYIKSTPTLKREEIIAKTKITEFDVLIIGGGASGAGAFLEASNRGLKAVLVEQNDFGSQTSSRSTKLVHGGVRYLENAVKKFDFKEYNLVKEALHERKNFLQNAPHLTRVLPIVTPVYSWFEVAYYLAGLKLYDFISHDSSLGKSKFLGAKTTLKKFPHLKKTGLVGSIIYYDGQFNDARMNLCLILTGMNQGGLALNYVKTQSLIKNNHQTKGAVVTDLLTGEAWPINAKVVINATGVFCDHIRKMDDEKANDMIVSSQGTHILLPSGLIPNDAGIIIPKTSDNRVLFLLPWLNQIIAGTTDRPADISFSPKASAQEVNYIIEHLEKILDIKIQKNQILATWSGLRPLINPLEATKTTAAISRDHFIQTSASKLITIAGGKWTTYRKMGEDVINEAINTANITPAHKSTTAQFKLVGADFYKKDLHEELEQREKIPADIAFHLTHTYGDRALRVIEIENKSKLGRLIDGYPFIQAEVLYAIRNEYAVTIVDILARRTRLAFLDNQAAYAALPKIIEAMASELKWSEQEADAQFKSAHEFLKTMFTVI